MPDDRAHNTVPGTVHGPVNQIGTVHGDVHIHPTPAGPSAALALRIANSITDPQRKARVLPDVAAALLETDPELGDQVVAQIQDPAARARFALRIEPRHPERATRLVEPFLDEHTDVDLRLTATIVCLKTSTDPDRTAQFVREAERIALGIIDQNDRDTALRRVSIAVAAADPGRAVDLLRRISPGRWAADHVWHYNFKQAAAADRDYALALFDHYFRALRDGDDTLDLRRRYLAISVVGVDPYRATAVTGTIHTTGHRVEAITGMIGEIATADRDQAILWLRDAKEIALTAHADRTKLLGLVAAAAVNLDPALSRQLTLLITAARSAHDLYAFAEDLAATDPAQAERLVEQACAMDHDHLTAQRLFLLIAKAFAEFDPPSALRTLDRIEVRQDTDFERSVIVDVLIRIATIMSAWDAADAKPVLSRALQELRAVRTPSPPLSTAWGNLAEALVRIAPDVVERLAAQMAGRDDVLAAMATGVARACASRTA
ncbi:hypothetical protein [Lentzea sp. NPDC051838]|uniref:hypothetical protein n=1 Tax=Lentzea sp. NPDC051838 TaxID=3154849 RepID=UPI003422D2D0